MHHPAECFLASIVSRISELLLQVPAKPLCCATSFKCLVTEKTQWKWTEKCKQAFKETKRLITSDVVLAHFNPSVPIRLACDASPYEIGAVLSHKFPDSTKQPIALASRSLMAAERNYAQIDREALSLV